jgi:hypothetical protein
MIKHYCVCDKCGNQVEIDDENRNLFHCYVSSVPLIEHRFNNPDPSPGFAIAGFGELKLASTIKRQISLSFCDKQCFINYMQSNMNANGTFNYTKDEIEIIKKHDEQVKLAAAAMSNHVSSIASVP